MKNMQQKKMNVSKITHPDNPLSYNEWVEKYNFGRSYIAPTPYFLGNELDMRKFNRDEDQAHKLSWQNIFKLPIKIILNSIAW